eukprot:Rmarinus@m.18778
MPILVRFLVVGVIGAAVAALWELTKREVPPKIKVSPDSPMDKPSSGGFECPICYEGFSTEGAALSCGHLFCKKCLDQHFRRSYKCPYCNSNVNREYTTMYLNPNHRD